MTVLLDTSVLIAAESRVLTVVADEETVVSAISVGELAHGVDIGDAAQREHRAARLRRVLRDLEVIPFGAEEARFYGVLATLGRTAGRSPRPRRLDLQSAATAAAARVPLGTANPRDFSGLDRLVDVIAVS